MYLFWILVIEYKLHHRDRGYVAHFRSLVPKITPKCSGIKWPYVMLMDSVHQELRQNGDGFSLFHDLWGPYKIAGDEKYWDSL